jgi:hypothetical protein
MAPSCRSAASSSVTNSGFPAAPAISASRPGPGSAATISDTRSPTAPVPSGDSARCRAPTVCRARTAPSSSAARGTGRKHPIIPTGRSARRRPIAASVTKLDGSAHCRSSAPTTTGPDRARASTRSPNASTTRNCSPGSLVTVTGASPLRPPGADNSPAIAARRGSAEPGTQPKAPASRPNGRARSSSSARPAATCMPRAAASASACSSRRVLPIPASPSTSTIARPPRATRSRASRRTLVSVSRPRSRGASAGMPISPMLLRPGKRPSRACVRCSRPGSWAGARRSGRLIQRSQKPEICPPVAGRGSGPSSRPACHPSGWLTRAPRRPRTPRRSCGRQWSGQVGLSAIRALAACWQERSAPSGLDCL